MKIIKKLLVVLLIIILVVLGVSFSQPKKEIDCVNSITNTYGNGCDERISVILYRKEIENKMEVAEEIIQKCEENSFKTIKFSYDMRVPNEINVNVYLNDKDFENGDIAFSFNYSHDGTGDPDEFNILENPERFTITLE